MFSDPELSWHRESWNSQGVNSAGSLMQWQIKHRKSYPSGTVRESLHSYLPPKTEIWVPLWYLVLRHHLLTSFLVPLLYSPRSSKWAPTYAGTLRSVLLSPLNMWFSPNFPFVSFAFFAYLKLLSLKFFLEYHLLLCTWCGCLHNPAILWTHRSSLWRHRSQGAPAPRDALPSLEWV